jgi:SlyX protein
VTDAPESLEARLTELEVRLAHFEAMVDELSTVVADQQRDIDRLMSRLQAASDRLEEMAASLPQPPDDQPPPHY